MKPRIYSLDGRAVVRALMGREGGVPYEVDAAQFWRDVELALVVVLPLVAVVVLLWKAVEWILP